MPTTSGPVWHQLNVSVSGSNLLLQFTSYNSFNLNGSPSSAWSNINFFFDLDNNPATGYSIQSALGSEMLVQGTGIYRETSSSFDSGSAGTATSSATTGSSYTITVPISVILAVLPSAGVIRICGLNDNTNEMIPPEGSYLSITV